MLPGKRYHDLVGLLQESSKVLDAQIPCGAARTSFELLLLERVDFARAPCSLLPKRIVSFVTKSEEDVSFSLMQGRFIVKLCFVSTSSSMSSEIKLKKSTTT